MMEVTLMLNFFLILSTIKMKLGQILMCCMTKSTLNTLKNCIRISQSFISLAYFDNSEKSELQGLY